VSAFVLSIQPFIDCLNRLCLAMNSTLGKWRSNAA
jgi:hypothetical protein